MDNSAAHDLQQPQINRALVPRAQLRWAYFLSLGTFFFLKRAAFCRVLVNGTGLRIDGPGGSVEVPFHQVHAVTAFGLPLIGGWITLKTGDGKKFRFSSFLERSDYVLDAIAIAQPTLVPSATLEKYRRTAIVADHLYARMELSFADWRMLVLMQIFFPLMLTMGVSVALSVRDFADAFLIYASVGLLNSFVSAVVWSSAELAEMVRKNGELIENPLNPLRDLGREKSAKFYSRLIHVSVAALLTYWMWLR